MDNFDFDICCQGLDPLVNKFNKISFINEFNFMMAFHAKRDSSHLSQEYPTFHRETRSSPSLPLPRSVRLHMLVDLTSREKSEVWAEREVEWTLFRVKNRIDA